MRRRMGETKSGEQPRRHILRQREGGETFCKSSRRRRPRQAATLRIVESLGGYNSKGGAKEQTLALQLP
ncbi:Hypothetical protein NTJ_05981 [Nesidiocoris tenuis]|uniref:Uncharacterized protein n=1 Tax=Nesidiocoris tenuis TaxID=355587 RepID=A0ABN7ALP9_9HEMI|nr:Hypothetical protein NTJ_05981 [Nesidiocoris tenuis]